MSHHLPAQTSHSQHPGGLAIATLAVVMAALVAGCSAKNEANADNDRAVAERIQKVGSVEVRDANRQLKSGEEVFKAQCSACHATGAAGAPKSGDASAWAPRIAQGFDALVNSALKGKGNMGPQGGGDFSDLEVARGVAYMANNGGAKFEEPKAPTAEGK